MGILSRVRGLMSRKNVTLTVGTVAGAALLATPAAAQDLSPITTMLTTIGDALTGPLGRAFGLVALAGVGFAFMTGRMNWPLAAAIVIGLAILFGAAAILAGF